MLNAVDESFLAALASQLPPGTLRAPEPRHLEEPRGRYLGLAGGLVCPGNTEEVALVLRAAQAARGLINILFPCGHVFSPYCGARAAAGLLVGQASVLTCWASTILR